MGDGTRDVLPVHSAVELDRGGKRRNEGIGAFGESPAPALIGLLIVHQLFFELSS
ncbi:hypothetical protein BN873_610037 [Candidatus Competibacter denitrificans Run_A_D11]|uniref:Uncharacterized protein n=1 Tax=Candidatus Competibacter denitrificans Run_A_D11 TaxID=1400863 RepID=W6MBT1_9GAMM|nr:hypothetical protein BN873_610037 [Candidatus Competibacter denitrificans Run_A_D11]